VVSGDYFQAVGIRLLRGRLFDDRDAQGAQHRLVVGARLAQEIFPGVDPIGQMLLAGGDTSVIIGVVNDVAVTAEGRTVSMVYHAHRQFAGDRNWSLIQVVSTSGPPASVAPAIRQLLARLDPKLVLYQPTALDEVIGRGRAQRVFTLRILATFAAVAILLAAIGLFGVLSYAVRLRSKEIGIRMALGADRWSIRAMVLRDGAIVTAIGVAVGLAGAVALSKIMSAVVFHVSPLDPAVLVGSVIFMAIVASFAAYLPARRASSVAPQSVLQGE
jgi:ABC-type antimicrobial peptide transport system permease subunit